MSDVPETEDEEVVVDLTGITDATEAFENALAESGGELKNAVIAVTLEDGATATIEGVSSDGDPDGDEDDDDFDYDEY